VVTLRPQDTFKTVLDVITFEHIHRVYVVDFEGRPLRVITLTDLLEQLFTQ